MGEGDPGIEAILCLLPIVTDIATILDRKMDKWAWHPSARMSPGNGGGIGRVRGGIPVVTGSRCRWPASGFSMVANSEKTKDTGKVIIAVVVAAAAT